MERPDNGALRPSPEGLQRIAGGKRKRRHRKCHQMRFHPVRRWQKTQIGGWFEVWHPIRGAGGVVWRGSGGGASLPPAIFWHPNSGCLLQAPRLERPENGALRSSPEGLQRIAGGKRKRRHRKCHQLRFHPVRRWQKTGIWRSQIAFSMPRADAFYQNHSVRF